MPETTEQQQQQQQKTEQTTPPRTYTEAELESRLRGSAKEIERLKAENEALTAAQTKSVQDMGAQREEYDRLLQAERTRATQFETELTAAKSRVSGYEQLLTTEVEATVAGIADEAKRTRVSELIKGRDVTDQRRILSTLMAFTPAPTAPAAAPVTVPPVETPRPGPKAPPQPDPKKWASSPEYRARFLQEVASRLKE